MKVLFGSLACENDDVLRVFRCVCLKRDPYAPISISHEDLKSFELRSDISGLRSDYKEATRPSGLLNSLQAKKVAGKIQSLY